MRSRLLVHLSFVLTVTLCVVNWFFWRAETSLSARIDFSVKTFFGTAAGVSLLVAYQTLRLNIYKDQIKGAFEFLTRFDREDERRCRDRVDELVKRTGSMGEYRLDNIPKSRLDGFIVAASAEDLAAARAVVSFFEDLSLAVRCGFAHEAVVYRSLGPVLLLYMDALRPYIAYIRKRDGDPVFYEDAMLLYDHWKHGFSIAHMRQSAVATR
jgi:hypothetical protein